MSWWKPAKPDLPMFRIRHYPYSNQEGKWVIEELVWLDYDSEYWVDKSCYSSEESAQYYLERKLDALRRTGQYAEPKACIRIGG